MKIIYLASFKAHHPNYDIVYQDINGKRDIPGDMMEVDLTIYDIIIATPPCNYYSKCLTPGRREKSIYAKQTKHLLPGIIKKLSNQSKPFIIENVRSSEIDKLIQDTPGYVFVYQHGRHTYWTNIPFNPKSINQVFDFKIHGKRLNKNTQGGQNVHNVIDYWLKVVTS